MSLLAALGIPAYCLTLARTPARTERARLEFSYHNLPVQMVEGIDGPAWGLATTHAYDYDGPKDPPYHMPAGAIGNLMSHWMLWQHVWLQPNVSQFLVFEDDVTLPANFTQQFAQTYAELPADWDVVYIGHVGNENHRVLERTSNRFAVIEHPFGTHAMLIRRAALPVLLRTQAMAWGPVDIQIAIKALPHLRYYCCTPSLAGQRTVAGEWPSLVNPKR